MEESDDEFYGDQEEILFMEIEIKDDIENQKENKMDVEDKNNEFDDDVDLEE